MTTLAVPLAAETTIPARRSPSLFRAWTSSFLVYFHPRSTSRLWLAISPAKAGVVALLNVILAVPWLLLFCVSEDAWSSSFLRVSHNFNLDYVPHPLTVFVERFQTLPAQFAALITPLDFYQKSSIVLLAFLLLAMAFVIPLFLLLPFAARPGANKPCVRHVFRSVLLATGLVHIVFPILSATYILFMAYHVQPYFDVILGPVTLLLMGLTIWLLGALISAARQDYRLPADLPQPKDPTCDICGYDLVAADKEGRCPECGTPVLQSVGPNIRPPMPWEADPSLLNLGAIGRQLVRLITQPRKLFLSMPTLSGHFAAHRWLLGSLAAVGVAAGLLVPAINLLLFSNVGLSLITLWGGLIIGMAWAILALMMVGIETAGIATFSKMKGHPVPLAAAAKVTAYSSPLMLFWILLGALQLLLSLYLWDQRFFTHRTVRVEQVYLALSLSIAHIGGLLWYELTVYRGIRSVQYANR